MNRRRSGGGFARRNRVAERAAVLIGMAAGLATVPAGAAPTGSTIVDLLLTALAVGFLTWTGASAPWWAVAGFAGVVTALAVDPFPVAMGIVAFAMGLWIGLRRRDFPELRAAATGLASNVSLWSALDEPVGLVPAIVVPCALLLAVLGIRRRRRPVRRVGWYVLGGAGAFVVVAVGMSGLTALSARSSLQVGSDLAQGAIDALDGGEYELATARFEAAADRLAQVDRQLGGPWTQPARLVPIAAQNRAAAVDLAAEAADGLDDAAGALAQVDLGSLRLVDGALDLEAVAAVEAPLLQVQDALARLDATIAAIDSVWVADPIRRELDELATEIVENDERLDTALSAVRSAPGFLGAEGQRRYLVIFTTPSEVRGLGGFPGNYAELTAVDGRLELSDFGRIADLEDAIRTAGGRCTGCPEEFVERYGRFGFTNGPDGTVAVGNWRNITAAAHFPYVAQVARVLYPQSGGAPIDGVLVVDPYVVEQFVEQFVEDGGTIALPELGVTVDEDNVLSFILYGQYLTGEPNQERIDALETIGLSVIADLLSSSLPAPAELAEMLGPLVQERRLLFWTEDPDEQALLDDVGLLGGIPRLDPRAPAGFSVSLSNAGGNKIDVFLRREVQLSVDETAGVRQLVAEVTLHNDAPSSGLPRNVIGNLVSRPDGTSRLWVTFYAPGAPVSASLNGVDTPLEVMSEAGWAALGQYVDIPPRSSVTYRLVFDLPAEVPPDAEVDDRSAGRGAVGLDGIDVVTWDQPIIRRPSDRRPDESG